MKGKRKLLYSSSCERHPETFVRYRFFKSYHLSIHDISLSGSCEYGEESKNAGTIHEGIKQLHGFTNNDTRGMLFSLLANPSSLNVNRSKQ